VSAFARTPKLRNSSAHFINVAYSCYVTLFFGSSEPSTST